MLQIIMNKIKKYKEILKGNTYLIRKIDEGARFKEEMFSFIGKIFVVRLSVFEEYRK